MSGETINYNAEYTNDNQSDDPEHSYKDRLNSISQFTRDQRKLIIGGIIEELKETGAVVSISDLELKHSRLHYYALCNSRNIEREFKLQKATKASQFSKEDMEAYLVEFFQRNPEFSSNRVHVDYKAAALKLGLDIDSIRQQTLGLSIREDERFIPTFSSHIGGNTNRFNPNSMQHLPEYKVRTLIYDYFKKNPSSSSNNLPRYLHNEAKLRNIDVARIRKNLKDDEKFEKRRKK